MLKHFRGTGNIRGSESRQASEHHEVELKRGVERGYGQLRELRGSSTRSGIAKSDTEPAIFAYGNRAAQVCKAHVATGCSESRQTHPVYTSRTQ